MMSAMKQRFHTIIKPERNGWFVGWVELGERRAEPFRQPALGLCGIQRRDRLGLDLVQGPALHEQALHRIQRRERVVPALRCAQLGFDAEELADEGIEIRRQLDQQLGFGFWRGRARAQPRGAEPIAQRRIVIPEKLEECRIHAQQAVALIEIGECKTPPQAQVLCGRRRQRVGNIRRRHIVITNPSFTRARCSLKRHATCFIAAIAGSAGVET